MEDCEESCDQKYIYFDRMTLAPVLRIDCVEAREEEEVILIIRARGEGSLDQGRSYGSSEKRLESEYILKV